jgi:hypothetical protein
MPSRFTLALAALLLSGSAEAQISRVFVSVVGNDANSCSNIATPCRTLGAGINQVDPQGEVIVIDSGSYAGGTISKSVRVNVAAGVVAFSGLPITVDPGAGGTVVLRGLTLKAAMVGSGTGVTHLSGTLFIENTVIDGWNQGLLSAGDRLHIKGSVIRNTFVGLEVQVGHPVRVAIDDTSFTKNMSLGLLLNAGTGRVSNTVLTANNDGAAVQNAGSQYTFQRCEVSGNANRGLLADTSALLAVSHSTIAQNFIGILNVGAGAVVQSFGNNVMRGNTTNTSGTITPVTLQ